MFEKMKRNKVHTAMVLIVFILMLTMNGCSKGESDKDVNAEELAYELKSGIEFEDDLSETDMSVMCQIYGMENDDIMEIKAFMGSGATAEEIVVVKKSEEADIGTLEALFKARIEEQKSSYESYDPEEVDKLDKAIVRTIGDSIVLCVCNDPKEANLIIDNYLGKS